MTETQEIRDALATAIIALAKKSAEENVSGHALADAQAAQALAAAFKDLNLMA